MLSAAIIARNEEKVLPRLLKSLKGISDICVVSTGSTDKTVEIAKEFGCNVIEVGDRFKKKATEEQVKEFRERFGIEPSFKAGVGYFHFADARNFAASQCKNDVCAHFDADEIVDWNLEEVKRLAETEDQLTYQFCFEHNPDGTPALEFEHSKILRKSKIHWIGQTHEIHTPIEGQTPKPPCYTDAIYLHHWQEPKPERGNYLPGLELSVLNKENPDRNQFYLAREYFYNKKWQDGVKMFEAALKIMWWKPERGQAYIFLSRCYKELGKREKAEECLFLSLKECDTRREPWFELGELTGKPYYYEAAMSVPFSKHGYINEKNLYGWVIPEKLAAHYGKAGDLNNSKKWWLEALKYNPPPFVLSAFENFYGKAPLISIVVPTCRPEGFKRLKESIEKFTLYPNIEIIEKAGEGTAVTKFNEGVEEAEGEIVVFMADDTEATYGWLIQAYVCLQEKLKGKGLVIFNDAHWEGSLANHWMASRDTMEELGETPRTSGNFFNEAYNHCSVDVELHCRLRDKRMVEYCPEAKIVHHHYHSPSRGTKPDKKDKFYEKIEGWANADRVLLPKRLEMLGLHEDAVKYQEWYSRLLEGNPNGPERRVVGSIAPVPLLEGKRYEWAAKTPCKTVLDIGCSSGFGSRFFAVDYTGVDYDEDVIKFAKDQYTNVAFASNPKFIHADIHDFELKHYDTIVAFEVLEHLKDGKELAQKLKKHCENLFCSCPYKEPPGALGQYHVLHGLTEKDFPGFTYQWLYMNGEIHDKPDPGKCCLMLMHYAKC